MHTWMSLYTAAIYYFHCQLYVKSLFSVSTARFWLEWLEKGRRSSAALLNIGNCWTLTPFETSHKWTCHIKIITVATVVVKTVNSTTTRHCTTNCLCTKIQLIRRTDLVASSPKAASILSSAPGFWKSLDRESSLKVEPPWNWCISWEERGWSAVELWSWNSCWYNYYTRERKKNKSVVPTLD